VASYSVELVEFLEVGLITLVKVNQKWRGRSIVHECIKSLSCIIWHASITNTAMIHQNFVYSLSVLSHVAATVSMINSPDSKLMTLLTYDIRDTDFTSVRDNTSKQALWNKAGLMYTTVQQRCPQCFNTPCPLHCNPRALLITETTKGLK